MSLEPLGGCPRLDKLVLSSSMAMKTLQAVVPANVRAVGKVVPDENDNEPEDEALWMTWKNLLNSDQSDNPSQRDKMT